MLLEQQYKHLLRSIAKIITLKLTQYKLIRHFQII